MGSESNKIRMLLPGGWNEEGDGTGVRNRHIEDFIFLTILDYRGLQNASVVLFPLHKRPRLRMEMQ